MGKVLPWTSIGPLLDVLLDREALTKKELAMDEPHGRMLFTELSIVVMPRFIEKLSSLLSLLESQAKAVEDFQAKALAIMVSGVITSGQLLASLANKYFTQNSGNVVSQYLTNSSMYF